MGSYKYNWKQSDRRRIICLDLLEENIGRVKSRKAA